MDFIYVRVAPGESDVFLARAAFAQTYMETLFIFPAAGVSPHGRAGCHFLAHP
jgi:hypothetical protein